MTEPHSTPIPNCVAIAGVDPSGGAGLLADIKTFTALGAFGCGVVTALTAQNTCGVTAIHTPPPTFLAAQLDTLFADLPVAAIKTGMLGNRAVIETVAAALRRWFPDPAALPPLVVDPVMIATSGDRLLDADAVSVLVEQLLPLATVVTPNLPEAAALTGLPEATSRAEMRRTAERLRALLPATSGRWVVLKGGHLPGDELIDLAFDGETMLEFRAPRQPYGALHGTGCTLAAALTAELGFWYTEKKAASARSPKATPLPPILTADAAQICFAAAHRYLQRAIGACPHIAAGRGAQPLGHMPLRGHNS
ncbi:bifunctional hydroxymethylpyrimidine kinase/phosphomethylpyrimidine kinase [Hydrogenophilus thermoluteolus]|uniref:hydroxymethylpyrimidine kinase n=1 Tax=Hydrogenophilus thermoluteolus TaxID=297 RepID=A0A2Z6E112_HYDTE|nr:bifunctional hydroxymethylpyrimidine kinase/phosphomethylpyrimidine kinase [Hydrogenophilus thermoluteolus]BBD78182.1 hydroxymethylpyrimidine/phosphomethylpyrimidine kinase [Hydrogenophilus thermoluteolus]